MYGHGLARQQRLINDDGAAVSQQGVGGDAVAFGDPQGVATHHFEAGDDLLLAVAHDGGLWTGEVTQCIEGTLGAAFLNDRDRDDHDHEAQQHQPFADVTEQQVKAGCAQQQQKHRLFEHLKQQSPQRPSVLLRQGVRAFVSESTGSFETAQSRAKRWG